MYRGHVSRRNTIMRSSGRSGASAISGEREAFPDRMVGCWDGGH